MLAVQQCVTLSLCLHLTLYCLRFARSCRHVIRTPLMPINCNMMSLTLLLHVGAHTSLFTGESCWVMPVHCVSGKCNSACCCERLIVCPSWLGKDQQALYSMLFVLAMMSKDCGGTRMVLLVITMALCTDVSLAQSHFIVPHICVMIEQFVVFVCSTVPPLPRGKPQEKCPLCQTSYLPEFKGIVCKICQVNFACCAPPFMILVICTYIQ